MQAAAEDGYTHKKNFDDLNKIKILPKQLAKIIRPNYSTNFFGSAISSPIILSPMGHQTQFHSLGEVEVAKGVEKSNTIGFLALKEE